MDKQQYRQWQRREAKKLKLIRQAFNATKEGSKNGKNSKQ
jgi:hypothetical protein